MNIEYIENMKLIMSFTFRLLKLIIWSLYSSASRPISSSCSSSSTTTTTSSSSSNYL